MSIRRLIFWAHLTAGVSAGVVIFIMCVTGVLLAFERQVNDWADAKGQARVDVHSASRKAISSLLGDSEQQRRLSAITIYADAAKPVALAFGRERIVFVDPYSGRKSGEGSRAIRTFFASVERFHRALGESLQSHGLGRAVTGFCNLVFLGLLTSGLYLWMPKRWRWPRIRNSLFYQRGLTGKARYWNWHNVTGVWCAIPLFFIVLSGVIMSYTWANNLLYQLSGTKPPEPVRIENRGGGRYPQQHSSPSNLDLLFDRAKMQVSGWKSITLRLTPGNLREATFTIDRGTGGQPQNRDQLTLDKTTGELIRWEPFTSLSLGRRLRSLARFTHTGEAGGLFGQLLAAVVTTGGAFLVWTGFTLALRRAKRASAERKPKLVEAMSGR
jgi:uncharacterized iron-regulated membrane protein